jgi:hypothetical protein
VSFYFPSLLKNIYKDGIYSKPPTTTSALSTLSFSGVRLVKKYYGKVSLRVEKKNLIGVVCDTCECITAFVGCFVCILFCCVVVFRNERDSFFVQAETPNRCTVNASSKLCRKQRSSFFEVIQGQLY